ncbi:methylated-DNA--[protein]-cysteine S-methyltransferase [Antrihabitans cavernicola]|uniref:Methylated-DNA--protein-cysteine methyltransferase n=1 Tax=Antrihabitans cavernicola TaxID=2495913 RepID=A0A5A7SGR8_9NOCA|nr:methylated-DNA--[protein]-cysteine S-methyltransferase [Spelaeibacter cavernicola]KAA0024814.1 methylated-DNA--[protein]-cysteine S-methyltransferase [Spelaeibacter cavernicola]
MTAFDEPSDGETLRRLRNRLTSDAHAAGILDVAYRTIDSPIGTLLLASTPIGLVQIAFENEDSDAILTMLSDRISPRVLEAPARLDAAAAELDEYFAGTRRRFDLPLDLQLAGGFRRQVIEHLREIDYGKRESYGTVAAAIGNPRAVRAVGTACGHNPLPLVIPCHRVVRADGAIGQYRGGVEAKTALLALEAV